MAMLLAASPERQGESVTQEPDAIDPRNNPESRAA
jgi:hypothetical protein